MSLELEKPENLRHGVNTNKGLIECIGQVATEEAIETTNVSGAEDFVGEYREETACSSKKGIIAKASLGSAESRCCFHKLVLFLLYSVGTFFA